MLTGVAATREQFLAQAPHARVIHLAAHGGLNNRDPLASFVRLAPGKAIPGDGVITAGDILDMHLNADLVVLSACETALGKTGPGEGMMGMGWALSVAGASSSILSYWKIDSAASKDFMIAFYRHMGDGGRGNVQSAFCPASGSPADHAFSRTPSPVLLGGVHAVGRGFVRCAAMSSGY